MTPAEVRAPDVLTAWRTVVGNLLDHHRGAAFHVTVRIGNDPHDLAGQDALDDLLAEEGLSSTHEVANTIFPLHMASTSADYHQLSARYRTVYPRIRMIDKANQFGTYFGRLVAFPDSGHHSDQLSHVIEKLAVERPRSHRSSRYECAIYSPKMDSTRALGFPCMSNCAFHFDPHTNELHLSAVYRNQYLIERGFGNYLGLSRLRNYVADQAGLQPGELMITAGHAEVDGTRRLLRSLLGAFNARYGPI